MTVDLAAVRYYIRPVYEPAVGVEWEVWGPLGRVGQRETFREAVKLMEADYGGA